MKNRWFWAAVLAACLTAPAARAAVTGYTPQIVQTFPHDPQSFTEGLFYKDGYLYESTGLNGHSSIKKEILDTGKYIQDHELDPKYFGEGIVAWKNKLIGLTYKAETGFVYDLKTFNVLSDFHYTGEGWGLTEDGSHVIMSDGSSDLRILDPDSLKELRRVHVTCDGNPLWNINELEWVNGEIFANIWLTNQIVRIDPASGKVTGVIDVSALTKLSNGNLTSAVPNGIAYDAANDRLFVTGKLWPSLYQIKLSQGRDGAGVCPTPPKPN